MPILTGLEEINTELRLCDLVKEAFHTIQLPEKKQDTLVWWTEAFNTHKNLWIGLNSKDAEPDLSDSSRLTSLRFLGPFIFRLF